MPYQTIKKIIKKTLIRSFSQDLTDRNLHKFWFDHLHDILEWFRNKSAAVLRLYSCHDYLKQHLHRIKLTPDPFCQLCNSKAEMDVHHLGSYPALPQVTLWGRYRAARHKVVDYGCLFFTFCSFVFIAFHSQVSFLHSCL